jgi:hypothetical protein
MKKQHLIISLMVIILATSLALVIVAGPVSEDISDRFVKANGSGMTSDMLPSTSTGTRQQIEERILKSTIRFYIETWIVKSDESGFDMDTVSGHGTLKDGRYLVTHNHFSTPPSGGLHEPAPDVYALVTLTDGDGQALFRGPLSDFEIVWEDPETLVIAHKDEDLFERLGFVSAEFKDWSSVPLEAGMEVAQVDWDGTTTRVDWTTVQEVSVDDGTPRLVLADDVTLGASGGGIFWQGNHIANNWLQVQELGPSGELIDSTTKVALNSAPVAGGLSQVIASN